MLPRLPALELLAQINFTLTPLEFRLELLKIAVAVILLSFAAVAITLFFARSKSRELTLIYFGLFSTLYAVRLLAGLQIIQSGFGQSRPFWGYVTWLITCVIVLPFELFLYQISDAYLKQFFRWLITFQAGLSLLLILLTALHGNLDKLNFINSMSVLATIFSGPAFFLVTRGRPGLSQPFSRELRIFAAGFSVWLLFILQANLRTLRILSRLDIEFIGFFIFVCCLGYITMSRSFAKEEQLVTLNKELEIARQIQGSTLPREVPRISGLEIAARYVPMSAVAGDFYDFLAVDEHRVGILVADVTGHGVPAALIASMLKVAFAGQAGHADDPARVLTGLNRALCGKFEEHFVTAIYVFVDLASGRIRYGGAAHPPLLMASHANGEEAHAAQENGLMLGLFPEAVYESAEIQLREGDRCLLYTDGLFEAMNAAQEEFGKARVSEFLQRHSRLPAAQLATELLQEVARWSGHAAGRRQEDDITLLVLAFQKPLEGSA
jgi:phosphoserine phosphatase RsbU/P